jgi:hypothetical protein
MSNVLSDEKNNRSLHWDGRDGRCGGSSKPTGMRRETAGAYLKAAGIYVRPWGGRGRRAAAKPANEVTTDSVPAKPLNEAVNDRDFPKAANEVTTDSGSPDLPSDPTPYSNSSAQ